MSTKASAVELAEDLHRAMTAEGADPKLVEAVGKIIKRLEQVTPVDTLLGTRLRAWRLHEARHQGTKAFIILHDTSIDEIVRTKPQTLDALARVRGFGPLKVERYGAAILAVVKKAA